ncbi:MAG: HEAT repeat domain-containing protein [Spirochaetota bacterium]
MNVRSLILFSTIFLMGCATPKTIRMLKDIEPVFNEVSAQTTPDIARFLEATESGDREVRAEAVFTLSKFARRLAPLSPSRERVERLLLKLAETDSDFNVRCMAVFGIGEYAIDKKEAIPVINRSLADVSRQVMIEATKVARIYKDESSLLPLLANLRTTGRWLKMETIRTLAYYKDKRVDDAFLQIKNTDDDIGVLEEITAAMAKR